MSKHPTQNRQTYGDKRDFMLSVMAGTPSWATDGDAVQTSKDSTIAQQADEFLNWRFAMIRHQITPWRCVNIKKRPNLGITSDV